jgi:hypothetical protein
MAITFAERVISREQQSGDGAFAYLRYVAFLTDTDAQNDDGGAVRTAAESELPDTYLGLFRKTVHVEWVGPALWDVTLYFGDISRAIPTPATPSELTFEFGGGTQHITRSITPVSRIARAPYSVVEFDNIIGVDLEKKTIEGCDVHVPVAKFSYSITKWKEDVNDAYIKGIANLVAHYNNAIFAGFPAGEVLFLGASGSKRTMELWHFSFHFAQSPNLADATINGIEGINKLGWDYMWFNYGWEENEDLNMRVPVATQVNIDRVYQPGDFSALGI